MEISNIISYWKKILLRQFLSFQLHFIHQSSSHHRCKITQATLLFSLLFVVDKMATGTASLDLLGLLCQVAICQVTICWISICQVAVCWVAVCQVTIFRVTFCWVAVCQVAICLVAVYRVSICRVAVCWVAVSWVAIGQVAVCRFAVFLCTKLWGDVAHPPQLLWPAEMKKQFRVWTY